VGVWMFASMRVSMSMSMSVSMSMPAVSLLPVVVAVVARDTVMMIPAQHKQQDKVAPQPQQRKPEHQLSVDVSWVEETVHGLPKQQSRDKPPKY